MTRLEQIGQVPGLLTEVKDAEKNFLTGRQGRGEDLESAVRIFLEFL